MMIFTRSSHGRNKKLLQDFDGGIFFGTSDM